MCFSIGRIIIIIYCFSQIPSRPPDVRVKNLYRFPHLSYTVNTLSIFFNKFDDEFAAYPVKYVIDGDKVRFLDGNIEKKAKEYADFIRIKNDPSVMNDYKIYIEGLKRYFNWDQFKI